MEKKLFIILFFIFFQFDVSSADTAIDVKGFSSHIQAKLSEFGYLKELNEKYQKVKHQSNAYLLTYNF